MIELRWLKRETPFADGYFGTVMEIVLQYRIIQTHTLGETIYQDWMPWVDVPKVQEVKNETP